MKTVPLPLELAGLGAACASEDIKAVGVVNALQASLKLMVNASVSCLAHTVL